MSFIACIKWIKIDSPSFKPILSVGLLLGSSQMDCTNPCIAFLIFLALDLVNGPSGTCKGSLRLDPHWFPSFPLSSKGFDLESSPTSKGERLKTLKVAETLYSPGRSTLYALSLIFQQFGKVHLLKGWESFFAHVNSGGSRKFFQGVHYILKYNITKRKIKITWIMYMLFLYYLDH